MLRITKLTVLMCLVGSLWAGKALAQDDPQYTVCPTDEDICEVEWIHDGDIIRDALRNTIANDEDRPEGRIYMLERGGIYINLNSIENDGYHLRIIGSMEGAGEAGDFGPPVIQMGARDDGSIEARMINIQDDITFKNVWFSTADEEGGTSAYAPMSVQASDIRMIIDNVIFERNNFAPIIVSGTGTKAYITNSVYRNYINTSQQWEGRGIMYEQGADTLVMENNTFFNIGHTVVQSEARPINYVLFNQNTTVNVGRTLNSGGIWQEAYFTNNLHINPAWHGEGSADYDAPGRDTDYTGWFTIGELPPQFGADLGRRIVYANSGHWRDPQFHEFYGDTVRAQPLFADTTAYWFREWDAMVEDANHWQNDPDLVSYRTPPEVDPNYRTLEDLVPEQWKVINRLRANNESSTWDDAWVWDPGRDFQDWSPAGFVYPLPEDFSYATEHDYYTAGTHGQPLGDLNWFPDAKANYEANRDAWVSDIEAKAGGEVDLEIVATLEAADASVSGSASLEEFDGFGWYFFGHGGIEWEFEVPDAGQYDLELLIHMENGGMRAVNMFVNDTEIHDLKGWGEYVFDTDDGVHAGIPTNSWTWASIVQDEIVEDGALTLHEGTNTVTVNAGWGEISVASLRVLPAGSSEPVAEMIAQEAAVESGTTYRGAAEMGGERLDFIPRNWQMIPVEDGSVSWNVDLASDGQYFVRLFYQSESGAQEATLTINGDDVITTALPADNAERQIFDSDIYAMNQGSNTVAFTSNSGDLTIEYAQIFSFSTATSSDSGPEVVDGFRLNQNYPNPFNPATQISFELPNAADVRLDVYNLIGQRVTTLVNEYRTEGTHQVTFDGANLASGVYIYRLQMGNHVAVRKMTLIK
ncbi:T9SS type A sorting domain-containing protein [Balneolales bacterium ANBcel1]|nr:T9SS type A sorting domain-containing protein [Balneolales bacterium ANBcel1]